MFLKAIKKYNFLRKIYLQWLALPWTKKKLLPLLSWVENHQKLLDIGNGIGLTTDYLHRKGFLIEGIDLEHHSLFNYPIQKRYDGNTLPYPSKSFDVSLLLTVLHHSADPVKLLLEAKRVSHYIIIIEDVYESKFQKYLTLSLDTLVNLGFSEMTYQNKSDEEWKTVFKTLDLQLLDSKETKVLGYFIQKYYYLKA